MDRGVGGHFAILTYVPGPSGGGDTFLKFGVRGGPSKVVYLQFQAGGQTFENSLMLDPIQSFVWPAAYRLVTCESILINTIISGFRYERSILFILFIFNDWYILGRLVFNTDKLNSCRLSFTRRLRNVRTCITLRTKFPSASTAFPIKLLLC